MEDTLRTTLLLATDQLQSLARCVKLKSPPTKTLASLALPEPEP